MNPAILHYGAFFMNKQYAFTETSRRCRLLRQNKLNNFLFGCTIRSGDRSNRVCTKKHSVRSTAIAARLYCKQNHTPNTILECLKPLGSTKTNLHNNNLTVHGSHESLNLLTGFFLLNFSFTNPV